MSAALNRPIRVVVFGGGPGLEPGFRRFLSRLHHHSEIWLLDVICQSPGNSTAHLVEDLWKRRGWLALPLAAANLTASAWSFLAERSKGAAHWRHLQCMQDRIRLVADIHAPEVLEHVRLLAPELGLVYGGPILRPELFTIPARGTLGIHHGTLPRYRGKKTTFWEMYHGETDAGVTIQRLTRSLDAGDVVDQGLVPIGCRSRRRVWAELEQVGVELYIRAILKVRDSGVFSTPRVGPRYELCRDPSLRQILGLWWRQLRARVGAPLPPGPGPAILPSRRQRTA